MNTVLAALSVASALAVVACIAWLMRRGQEGQPELSDTEIYDLRQW